MVFSFILCNFLGFVLEVVPTVLLLFHPYDREQFRLSGWKRTAYFALYGVAAAAYPVYCLYQKEADYYQGIVQWIAVLTFFVLIRDRFSSKMVVWFTAGFFGNLRELLIWATHMVHTVFQGIPIESVYTDTHFPYNSFQLLVMLILTLLLLPGLLYFERKILKPYLSVARRPLMWAEMLLLVGASMVCFMSVVFYVDWFGASDDKTTFFILIPFGIILLLNLCVLFVLVFRGTLIRAKEQENWRQMELMRENFRSVQQDMEHSRGLYHDLRQLLRQLHIISDNHQISELKPYIEKIVSLTEHTDTIFCENHCMNGLLQYYTGYANEKHIPLLVSVVCGEVQVDDADLTLLLANALENAIEGAGEYRDLTGEETRVSVIAGIVGSYLAIQITNGCAEAVYSPDVDRKQPHDFLPADCFQSRHEGGGYGLKKIHILAKKYHGTAEFMFDEKQKQWITRISLLATGNAKKKKEKEKNNLVFGGTVQNADWNM